MGSFLDYFFVRTKHVCPWWLCWTFDNAIRKLFHNPYKILSSLVHDGDIVVDIGCGMGYFSIPIAQLVGEHGRVIAVDLQSMMLGAVRSRAEKSNVSPRITTHQASLSSLAIQGQVDFAIAFWMVHEVPDRAQLFADIMLLLKDNAKLLIVEPRIHVSSMIYQETIEIAKKTGFKIQENPRILLSRACLMAKNT
jgi:ubiquinone/menaquinone biosynthesis C-methylase UbiE